MFGLQICYFISHLMTIYRFYIIFLNLCCVYNSKKVIYYSNINLPIFLLFYESCVWFTNFLFYFTLNVNLHVLCNFFRFLFRLQFLILIYYSNINLLFFYFTRATRGLQIFCFISHLTSIYKFYVIFLSFCFIYNFLFQFTTPH